jgi:hypothetical protein
MRRKVPATAAKEDIVGHEPHQGPKYTNSLTTRRGRRMTPHAGS